MAVPSDSEPVIAPVIETTAPPGRARPDRSRGGRRGSRRPSAGPARPSVRRTGTATSRSTRRPSWSRPRWSTASSPARNWLCAASRPRPAASASASTRAGTSRAEFAWMVPHPPSWPVLSAASSSTTSAPAHLADDEPVGSHPQRLPHERAQGDLAGALDVGRACLEPDHVRMVGAQLAGVLDQDEPLGRRATSESRELSSVVLPGAGAAADQERQPARDQRRSRRAPCVAHRAGRRPARRG